MAAYRKRPIRPLETERLLLRPLQESDAERTQLLFPDFEVLKYMASVIPWPYPPDGAIEFVRRSLPKIEAQEEYYWTIVLKSDPDQLSIGTIGLTPASDEDHRGFWIGRDYWGQGYMREATRAVNDFAFDELEMTELLLSNAQPNIGSHRLKGSIGAEIIKVEDRTYVGGTFPGVHWRLTAEQWRAHRQTII